MEPLQSDDPRELGGYRLLGALGTGGMGTVFLGRAPDGRTVAVKLIHAHLAREPEFRRRFRQEVAAARRVSGQWTMPVLDSDVDAEVPWLATGFVPGPSLTRVVERLHGALPEFTVWRLAEGLAHALATIHEAGVMHRDLKPSNVLITLEGPRVIDFGIARAADVDVATRTGVAVGSPGYMAPEQIRGEHATAASDVFGLGAVLAYAATATGPFGSDSSAHSLMYRVVAEPPELGGLSGPLRALVERCLSKEAAERPAPAEIAREAARHQDPDGATGVWLPPGLTAELGKEAARLLDLGEPPAVGPPTGAPPVTTPDGSAPHALPTMASPPPRAGHTPPTPLPHPPTQATPAPYPLPGSVPGQTPYPQPYPGQPYPQGSGQHVTAPWPQPGGGYPPAGPPVVPVVPVAPVPASGAYPVTAGYPAPYAPFGVDRYGRPLSHKSKITAGLLQIFLGVFGVGRFYTGHVGMGIAQLLTCGGWGIWALIDGIIILAGNEARDSQGRILRG